MSKDSKSTTRRALFQSAALAAAATALAALPAIPQADAASDPVFVALAERDRILVLYSAVKARVDAIRKAWNGDLSGCGWPPMDKSLAIFADMPQADGEPIFRCDIERYNRAVLSLTPKRERVRVGEECAARLEWWDRRQAEREHNAEVSGFRAADAELDTLCEEANEAEEIAIKTPATTLAGALARLEIAVKMIRDKGAEERGLDLEETAIIGAFDDLTRLLSDSRGLA